ncbi:MAG: hypothetical protein IPM64_00805 [Phycisphaerales bacterium]|nr:hypothetical protein [Phycisphaerales bacterium]
MSVFGEGRDLRTDISRVEALSHAGVDPWASVPSISRDQTTTDYATITHAIREWRAQLVQDVTSPLPYQGELLLYFYDLSMDDGIAEDASGGLCDRCNRPLPLFWVMHIEDSVDALEESDQLEFGSPPRYVCAWIPEPLLIRARLGVAANAERCLYWITEVDCRRLRAASLLANCLATWRGRPWLGGADG